MLSYISKCLKYSVYADNQKSDIKFNRNTMKKKICIIILSIVIVCSLLSGCGDKHTAIIMKNAKDFTLTQEISESFKQENYGIQSYAFLKYIQENLPGRIAGTEKEKEMASFISAILLNGGYSEKDIKLNSFDIEEGVPMMDTSGENIFDGGEDSQSSQNIEVIKEGQSKKTIIVGAHYDSAGTHGVDDNGSGVAVALESALRMIDVETPYTIKYVFFGAEETGMHGSKEYVNSLTKKEKDNIVLMINIDSILAGDNLYLYGGRINDKGVVKDVEAVNKAFEIAKKANLPMQLTPKGNVDYPYPTGQKRSDHAPFSDIGIPYIYFEANNWLNGLPVETENHGLIMHSDKDDLSFIENEYGNRAKDTMANYSHLLHLVLQENNWE